MRRHGSYRIAFTLTAACCLPAAVHAAVDRPPLAVIAELTGRVDVARASSRTTERGTIGLALQRGDRVQVAAGATAILLLNDGDLLELPAKSAITVGGRTKATHGSEPDPVMAGVFQSVSEGVVGGSRETGLVALAPVRGTSSHSEIILSPRETDLLDDRPSFRWHAVQGATRYRVAVSGEAGDLWQRETSDTALAYPEDAAPLPRGADLLWRLQASNDGGRVREEENVFRIKPAEERDAIVHGLAQVEKGAGNAAPFLAAAYLGGQGLMMDAIDRLERLCRARPGEPGPHEALGQLYRSVGLMDLAAAELQQALTLGRRP